jgi:hypothetical protein
MIARLSDTYSTPTRRFIKTLLQVKFTPGSVIFEDSSPSEKRQRHQGLIQPYGAKMLTAWVECWYCLY